MKIGGPLLHYERHLLVKGFVRYNNQRASIRLALSDG